MILMAYTSPWTYEVPPFLCILFLLCIHFIKIKMNDNIHSIRHFVITSMSHHHTVKPSIMSCTSYIRLGSSLHCHCNCTQRAQPTLPLLPHASKSINHDHFATILTSKYPSPLRKPCLSLAPPSHHLPTLGPGAAAGCNHGVVFNHNFALPPCPWAHGRATMFPFHVTSPLLPLSRQVLSQKISRKHQQPSLTLQTTTPFNPNHYVSLCCLVLQLHLRSHVPAPWNMHLPTTSLYPALLPSNALESLPHHLRTINLPRSWPCHTKIAPNSSFWHHSCRQ